MTPTLIGRWQTRLLLLSTVGNLQKFRWDSDWPAVYQLFTGVWESVFIFCGVKLVGVLPIPIPKEELPIGVFWLHYSFVWLAVFITSQSVMRIIFPRWRFRGGQWL